MTRQEEINRAIELISIWFTKIKLNSAIGYFDINKTAENVTLVLLENIYGYSNLETFGHNAQFPAIDLGDKNKKIAVQVTSRTDSRKITESIRKFLKYSLDKDYNTIKFVILDFSTVKTPDNFPTEFGRFILKREGYASLNEKSVFRFIQKKAKEAIKVLPFDKFISVLDKCIDKEYISEQALYSDIEPELKKLGYENDVIKQSIIFYNNEISKFLDKKIVCRLKKDVISYQVLISELTKLQRVNKQKFKNILNELEQNLIYTGKSNFFFFTEDIKNGFKDTDNKLLEKIEKRIVPEMIQGMRETYLNYSKTFLNPEPQNFYETYFPLSISLGDEIHSDVNALSIFGRQNENPIDYITIIGGAGTGKSTLVKHLFLSCIEQYVGIPILIEFRTFNDFKGRLLTYISNEYFYKIKEYKNAIHDFLKIGKIVFIFDGFDELYSSKIQSKLKELDSFINLYGNNKFLITSRPGTNIQRFSRFKNAEILELNDQQIPQFIFQQSQNRILAERINQSIFLKENNVFIHFLKNPLLLSMYIFTYANHPELPSEKKEFYENIFKTLYEKHDGRMKDGFVRERQTKLKRSDFDNLLQRFSFKSYFNGIFEFTESYLEKTFKQIRERDNWSFDDYKLIQDLETGISILIQDNAIYKFPHRSIQEYFVAACINNFPENIKIKIFKEKLDIYEEVTADSTMNLWDLCNEFDRFYFLEYFILRNFEKKFAGMFNMKEDEFYKYYLKILDPILILPTLSGAGIVQKISINYVSKNYNLIKFSKIQFDRTYVVNGKKLTPRTKDLYSVSENNTIILKNHINDKKLYYIIKDIGLVDLFRSETVKIEKQIEDLKKELKSDKQSYNTWLNEISDRT